MLGAWISSYAGVASVPPCLRMTGLLSNCRRFYLAGKPTRGSSWMRIKIIGYVIYFGVYDYPAIFPFLMLPNIIQAQNLVFRAHGSEVSLSSFHKQKWKPKYLILVWKVPFVRHLKDFAVVYLQAVFATTFSNKFCLTLKVSTKPKNIRCTASLLKSIFSFPFSSCRCASFSFDSSLKMVTAFRSAFIWLRSTDLVWRRFCVGENFPRFFQELRHS